MALVRGEGRQDRGWQQWWPMVLLAFLVGAGLSFGVDRAFRSDVTPRPSAVPSHITWSPANTRVVPSIQAGIGIAQAEAQIRAAGLTPVIRSVHPLGAQSPFTFVGQAPEGGTVVLEGTAITLFAL
jgi:hypothetical protein